MPISYFATRIETRLKFFIGTALAFGFTTKDRKLVSCDGH